MCNWCNKETRTIPQVSGCKVPMICEECGTHQGWLDWKELRDRLNKAEGRSTRILTRQESLARLLERARRI